MSQNKSLLIILFFVALISLGAVAVAINYSGDLKNLPAIVQVTENPIPTFLPDIGCPSSAADIDGNIYKTVQIGAQCWLKENLKVTKNTEGNPITRYCYDNDPKICDTDGGLYDWNTAMNNSTEEGAQGICPAGWHVPKDSEWYVLEKGLATENCSAIKGSTNGRCNPAGEKLRKGGSSGFDAIFAGFSLPLYNDYTARGIDVYFWSSTEIVSKKYEVWERILDPFDSSIRRGGSEKTSAFSLRCLKD